MIMNKDDCTFIERVVLLAKEGRVYCMAPLCHLALV